MSRGNGTNVPEPVRTARRRLVVLFAFFSLWLAAIGASTQ